MPNPTFGPFNPFCGNDVLREALRRLNLGWARHAPLAGLRCVRLMPRIDGTMYFDLEWNCGSLRCDWIGEQRRKEQVLPQLAFSGPREKSPPGLSRLRQDLARAIRGWCQDEAFRLLHFYNRSLEELVFDGERVDVFLAGRFVPERTAWFDWRFSDCRQEREAEFEIVFTGQPGPLRFRVAAAGDRPSPGAEVVFAGPLFSLALVEDCRSVADRAQVRHQVERFVGFLLNRAVHGKMRPRTPPAAAMSGEPISTSRFGNPRQWRQFFSDFEIQRAGICGMRFTDPIAWITHGEGECTHVEPTAFPRPVFYTNLPWIAEPTPHEPGSVSFFTNLAEREAVHGGLTRFERALQEALAAPRVRFVCVNNTCMPKITGDDVTSVIRRHRKHGAVPILSMNTDLSSPEATFSNLLNQAKQAAPQARKARAGDAGTGINLVGFPPTGCRPEIEDALRQLGIRVNTWLLPEVGLRGLAEYRRGDFSVVYPTQSWIDAARSILAPLGPPCEVLPAPFGREGSLRWFERVTALAQVKKEVRKVLDRPEERREFAALFREAREFALGVVVPQDEIFRLTDPSRCYGVPMLPMLDEMGFGLEILVYGPQEASGHVKEALNAAWGTFKNLKVASFNDPVTLHARLRQSRCAAVYSEVFFDRRLTSAGKSQFHLGMIEPGLSGALRTMRRLLALCRWPFYRRYARYLGKTQVANP